MTDYHTDTNPCPCGDPRCGGRGHGSPRDQFIKALSETAPPRDTRAEFEIARREFYDRQAAFNQQQRHAHYTSLLIRPAFIAFAEALERRARKNDHKEDWAGLSWMQLDDLLTGEVDELMGEIWRAIHGQQDNIPHEAEDVALCAFFLWDKAQEKPSQDRGRKL